MSKIKQKNSDNNAENYFQAELFQASDIQRKKLEISYTGHDISSDGGALLLREVEKQIGLINSLTKSITDNRDKRYISHEVFDLLTQRIFQIACGYEDANDCNALSNDPIIKMCCDKLPYSESDLSSQPTMSRFENSVSRTDLYRIARNFVDIFMSSYSKEPLIIIIDCDDTNNNTHGDQQLTLFNDYYGENCYMPIHIYEGLTGKLITTILKPGKRLKSKDVFNILYRLIKYMRKQWKNTRIIIRGDSHFCSRELMDWAHSIDKVHFITGLSGNNILNGLAKTTIQSAEKQYQSTGKSVKIYHSFEYKAETWTYMQRVIVKVEVNSKGTNVRYIVTDLRQYRTTHLYKKGYCARGNMELRIKDHKTYLKSDRSSCHKFEANQFRLFLHSAAYVLIHTLQKECLRGTEFVNATMKTIQLKVLKAAAWVKELKTKIKIEFPRSYPYANIHSKSFVLFENIRC